MKREFLGGIALMFQVTTKKSTLISQKLMIWQIIHHSQFLTTKIYFLVEFVVKENGPLAFIQHPQCSYLKGELTSFPTLCAEIWNFKLLENPRGVPESLWKPHQSKDMLFLHRHCTPIFVSTSKKNIFFRWKKISPKKSWEIFREKSKNRL